MKFVAPKRKIVDYLLTEPGKRTFFEGTGYSRESWERLQIDLLPLAQTQTMQRRQQTKYGTEFEISGIVQSPSGRAVNITSGWFRDIGDTETMRLITAYPA